ncbi:MAG: hypothetical protein NC250_01255 [Alistipes senegalensis]|nr:hypothetical protein [Bacteroides cellulosilyticus]MCM1351346.1 hypothetical protein [Alistipes senegalensis]
MKKILFLTISLLLAGCGASRQATKTSETLFRDTTTAGTTATTTDRTGQGQTAAEQERDEEAITVTTVYDTSQPVDPTTGTPPVKVYTEQIRRSSTKARQEAKIEIEEAEARITHQTTDEHSEQATIVEATSRRGMNAVQRILCTIGLLAIAGIAGWLLRRWFGR